MPFSSVDKRQQLISPWSLSLMVMAIIAVLVLLMPRNSFLTNPDLIGEPDALSVAYLQALVKANPANDDIRILYAEHLASIGRIEEADRELRDVQAAGVAPDRLIYLALRLSLLRLLADPGESNLRRRARAAMSKGLSLPAGRLSPGQWRQLADLLLQAGLPEQAARVYLRLASMEPDARQAWLGEAARWFVAAGRHEQAAAARLRLARLSGRADDAVSAVDGLLAANRPEQAMAVLPEFIARYPAERMLVERGMKVSLAMRRYATGRRWAHAWLKRHPDDAGIMRQLVTLEVASARPQSAYPWARRLTQLMPEDIGLREQLARIAEWTGHIEEAYRQWQWLVGHRRKQHDLRRAIELANALHDYEAVDRLLARAASAYGLSNAEVSEMARVQEKLGNPEQSEQARVAYLKKSPNDRAAWEELAMLREYMGKLDESAATWAEIERRFGRSETSVLNRARMLALGGEPEHGLVLMRSYADRRQPKSKRYWQVYGDLAWNLEYHDDAMRVYRYLWKHHLSGSLETQRLMILLREEGDVEMTLKISKQAWDRFHDPDVLLLAIESAIQVERWRDVERLMDMARQQQPVFRERRRYWLAHGQWMVHGNMLDKAAQDYQTALALAPGDAEARTGLLWVWIQSNQRSMLRHYLKHWQHDALEHEVYWKAYAAAYRQLGRHQQALPWFRKSIQAHPDDILWMLEYADALAASGRASGAWRLRRHLFVSLWPKSRLTPDYLRRNDIATVEALAALKRDLKGMPQASAWVESLLAHLDDPVLREFALRWYFDSSRHDRAAYWLLRQHAARLETPAWQQLALAMERNDLDSIRKILAHASGIDHVSGMLAYRQLNRLDDVWLMAMDTGMGAGNFTDRERLTMLRQARDIAALSPNSLYIGQAFDHFGNLNLVHWRAGGFYSRANRSISLQTAITELRSGFFPSATHEYALKLSTTFRLRRADWQAHVGFNDRPGEAALMQWGGALQYRPWQGAELGLSLAFNETSLQTSAFRLIGARDRMRASITSDMTGREYASVNLDLNRFHGRAGEAIARGYAIDATLAHRVQLAASRAEEQIDVRISGELVANRLQTQLSPGLQILLPGLPVSTVIPADFSSLGMGLSIRRGEPGNTAAIARMPAYLFDVWLGWQWPVAKPAYSLNLGIGMPLFGRDMLSLRAYVANSLVGSISNDSLYGISLRYSFRLGR